MEQEMKSIYSNDVWHLVELPEGDNLLVASGSSRRSYTQMDLLIVSKHV